MLSPLMLDAGLAVVVLLADGLSEGLSSDAPQPSNNDVEKISAPSRANHNVLAL